MKHILTITSIFLLPTLISKVVWSAPETVMRSRNEGTVAINASNVLQTGNLIAVSGLDFSTSAAGVEFNPHAGAKVGVAPLLQLSGSIVPVTQRGLGPARMHLHITTPGNDKLRWLGIALRLDVFLTTSLDTVTKNADETKPNYNPFIYPSCIVDFDWLALNEYIPLKTYFKLSFADDTQLLYRYRQLVTLVGLEWKHVRHSAFINAGAAFYQEKPNNYNPSGDASYTQYYIWAEPGARIRIFNRISMVGGLRLTLTQEIKPDEAHNAFTPYYLGAYAGVEIPLAFKETNTEAVRTLVFAQRTKEESTTPYEDTTRQNDAMLTNVTNNLPVDSIGLDNTAGFDYQKKQQELISHRKRIKTKMDTLEHMLRDIEHQHTGGNDMPQDIPEEIEDE